MSGRLMTSLEVVSIPPKDTHEWLKKRHYAKAVPIIQEAFALYYDDILSGVCTFGPPPRVMNRGKSLFNGEADIATYELNRLVVRDGLPKNTLSQFLSAALKLMPNPCVIVSYADGNMGHHGYIYQATNWLYCGETLREPRYLNKQTGKLLHPRTVYSMFGTRDIERMPSHIEIVKEDNTKHRYVKMMVGKKLRKRLLSHLRYDILPYPKGENKRYETGEIGSTKRSFNAWFD